MKKKNHGKRPAPTPCASSEVSNAEARHEAGHAVAALVCGYAVSGIDIIPQVVPGSGGQLGKAGTELGLPTIESITGRGEEAVIRILVVLFAGYIAEKVTNASAELEMNHEQSDGMRAMKYASFAIAPPIVQDGQVVTRIDEDRFRALWKRAEIDATTLVQKYAGPIDKLAALLKVKCKLSREEIDRCVRSADG